MKTIFEASEEEKWDIVIWEKDPETLEILAGDDESVGLSESEIFRLIKRLQEAHVIIRKRRIAREYP